MATGSIINSNDYNTIQNKIASVIGPGSGSLGYGQSIISNPVTSGSKITKAQWDALKIDLTNILTHQNGTVDALPSAELLTPVRFGQGLPNYQYDTIINNAITNKFKIGVGQSIIQTATSAVRSIPWYNNVSSTVTVSFGSADYARWFFNSGGKIRFSSNRSGGASTPQNLAWTNLLSSLSTFEFSGNSDINFYSLTNVDQLCYKIAPTSFSYSANNYSILAKSNIVSNSAGGATQLTFTIKWVDGYVIGPYGVTDNVTGNLTLSVSELRASGVMLPAGTSPFVIVSPTYNITPITGF